ncbi:MAG: hypothetical protein ACF8QF_14125 [Phycisphaerales bacterium]
MTELPRATPTVTRCVCRELEFADLLERARREHLDFHALRERTGCCTGCSMCEPYVRLTLATGRTEHPILSAVATRDALRLRV